LVEVGYRQIIELDRLPFEKHEAIKLLNSEVIEMDLAQVYYGKLQDLHSEVKSACKKLSALQSKFDRQVADIYHRIEETPIERLDELKCLTELKDVLQRRRLCKDEYAKLRPILGKLERDMNALEERNDQLAGMSEYVRARYNVSVTLEEVAAEMEVEGLR
jgi:phage shock protein A